MKAFDSGRWLRASRHLDRVLELPDAERSAVVESIRLEDPAIATDVEVMLEQHRQLSAEGFLDTKTPLKPVEASLAGVVIGAYTLKSNIGHGGMGSVWLASRSDGRYEGQVAVKLLNAALVGRGGEERFRREGTILARLAHPNIARLIDAGVSNTGQPYLVLELVEGSHLDQYCDHARLSVEERVRLFLDVQSAVAHAHANLIVHRDLKPSNVLVAADGRVKLLDFSIAKLIEDNGVSRLTREAGSAMTPKYAAPEQVNNGPITTATDVYSLGVLLYELLSGRHPAGPEPKSPAEFARAIAEDDGVKVSAAVGLASATDAAQIASCRSTTPERLQRALRGDLDTILGKALKKDPAERYASVAEFADDLRRHVDHQPISARPDAMAYIAAKFVRRHWRGAAATAAAILVLTTLVAFYTWRLAEERDRAQVQAEKAAQVSELLSSVLMTVDPYRTPGAAEPTVRNLLDAATTRVAELDDQPELQAEMFTVIGRTYERLGIYDRALPALEQSLAIGRRAFGSQHVRVAQSLNDLGVLQREAGNPKASEPLLSESLAMRRRLLGSQHPDLAITLVEWARTLRDLGRLAESEAPSREALAIRKAVYGDEHRQTATSKSDVAQVLVAKGDFAGAEPLLRENVATNQRLLGADHPNTAISKGSLGLLLTARGDPAAGEVLLRDSLETRRRIFGETHVEFGIALVNLAYAAEAQDRIDEARALIEQGLGIFRPQLGDQHPRVINATVDLIRVRLARGERAGLEPMARRALQARERAYQPGDWRIAQAQSLLGAALLAESRDAEAEPLMLAADRVLKPVPGRQARERDANRARLAELYTRQGRLQDAAAYR
jgi:serine/threonine protein kinase